MNITIIIGSIRKGRQSHKIAYYLEKELLRRSLEVDVIDLDCERLPMFEERINFHSESPGKAAELSNRLKQADALLLVTPEYHGSFSGVLKNALDYFRGELKRKPIGAISTSSGDFGGINASTQLQHLILSVGAYPVPLKLLVPKIHEAFDEAYEPQNKHIMQSTTKFLDEFIWFAEALYQKRNGENINPNPGEAA